MPCEYDHDFSRANWIFLPYDVEILSNILCRGSLDERIFLNAAFDDFDFLKYSNLFEMYEFSDSPIFSVEPNPIDVSLACRIFVARSWHSCLSSILGKIMAGMLPTDSSRKQSACRSELVITYGIKWVDNQYPPAPECETLQIR